MFTGNLPGQSDLERLVAGDEGGQTCQRLLARASHPHQQAVAAWSSDYTGDFHKMSHCILKEDQVHMSPSDAFIVLLAVELEALLKDTETSHLVDRVTPISMGCFFGAWDFIQFLLELKELAFSKQVCLKRQKRSNYKHTEIKDSVLEWCEVLQETGEVS